MAAPFKPLRSLRRSYVDEHAPDREQARSVAGATPRSRTRGSRAGPGLRPKTMVHGAELRESAAMRKVAARSLPPTISVHDRLRGRPRTRGRRRAVRAVGR